MAKEAEDVEDPDPAAMFSTHPEYLDALLHDPLVHRGPVPRQTIEAVEAAWPAAAAGGAEGRPPRPTPLLHRAGQPMAPAQDTRAPGPPPPPADPPPLPRGLPRRPNHH